MMTESPPLPKDFEDFASPPPLSGLSLSAAAAGLRYKGRDDVMLAVLEEASSVAGLLTKSSMPSHPVLWCREHLKAGRVRAFLTIAGNANALNGPSGWEALEEIITVLSEQIGCPADEILPCQTGTIGEEMTSKPVISVLPALISGLSPSGFSQAAHAIMTTDSFAKLEHKTTHIDGHPVSLTGFCKGSGMIAPNMATMLAFIFTDATLPASLLDGLIRKANEGSFNSVSIDTDCSTSDSLFFTATGRTSHPAIEALDDKRIEDFTRSLIELCQSLARKLAFDGEGARKLVTVEVGGAANDERAREIARSVVESPLVKTAIAGEDANWGRIVMAMGKTGIPFTLSDVTIFIGDIAVFKGGVPAPNVSEEALSAHLAGWDVRINIIVGTGKGEGRVWGCDLTHDYISINADYRS